MSYGAWFGRLVLGLSWVALCRRDPPAAHDAGRAATRDEARGAPRNEDAAPAVPGAAVVDGGHDADASRSLDTVQTACRPASGGLGPGQVWVYVRLLGAGAPLYKSLPGADASLGYYPGATEDEVPAVDTGDCFAARGAPGTTLRLVGKARFFVAAELRVVDPFAHSDPTRPAALDLDPKPRNLVDADGRWLPVTLLPTSIPMEGYLRRVGRDVALRTNFNGPALNAEAQRIGVSPARLTQVVVEDRVGGSAPANLDDPRIRSLPSAFRRHLRTQSTGFRPSWQSEDVAIDRVRTRAGPIHQPRPVGMPRPTNGGRPGFSAQPPPPRGPR